MMVNSVVWAMVVAIALAPSYQQATENAEPAPRASFERAAAAYNDGEQQTALDLLNPYLAAWQKAVAHPLFRQRLVESFELRARIRGSLGDEIGAREDFSALLRVDPNYIPPPQLSRQNVALIDEIRAVLVGTVQIRVSPSDATVSVDGEVLPVMGDRALIAGAHTLTATRHGYRSQTQNIVVVPRQRQPVDFTLQRVSAVLTVSATPPDAEVIVDGQSRGRLRSRDGSPVGELEVDGLTVGVHRLEIRRPCYLPRQSTVTINALDDLAMNPVVLADARGTLTVTSQPRGAQVFVGGTLRGSSPLTAKDLCEGNLDVEVRSAVGRFMTRVAVRAGAELRLDAVLKPTFALVSAVGSQAASAEVLNAIAKSLGALESVAFWMPPASAAMSKSLATLTEAGTAAVGASSQERRSRATRELANGWNVQGVALVASEDNRVRIDLYAIGSASPDQIHWPDDRAAFTLPPFLDEAVPLFQYSLAAKLADVAGFDGPVVVKSSTDGTLRVNDVLRAVAGQRVASVATLAAMLPMLPRNQPVVAEVADASGQVRTIATLIVRTPMLAWIEDETRPFNVHVLKFATRAAVTADTAERSVARINQAIAHMRLRDWDAAQQLLSDENPQSSGVSAGVIAFLLGECAYALNDPQAARKYWQTAAANGGLVTLDGPDVGVLAKARLTAPR